MIKKSKGEMRELVDKANEALKSSVVSLGVDPLDSDVEFWIPTGWSLLDRAIGGGFPVGRTVELYGKESSGKSTLSVHAMVNCQKMGGHVVLYDPEATFNKALASHLGVDLSKLIVINQKVPLEDIFNCFVKMLEAVRETSSEAPILLVWDTLAATPTKKEIEEQEDGGRMGGQYRAQIVRRGMRSITQIVSEMNACLLVLNHVYDSMGMGGMVITETPGGRGVKFHSSVRVHLKTMGWIRDKEDSDPMGVKILARIEKNKLASPRKEVETRIIFGQGFDNLYSLFSYAVEHGIVRRSGSWYISTVGDKEIKFYATNLKKISDENPEFLPDLEQKVFEHFDRENT